jgi:F0F1-type ATP synthase assembly protein I
MSGNGEDDQGSQGTDRGSLKALALATQLGFAVAGPLLVFIALGVWADGQFGTKPWLFFVGLLLGVVSAGAALFQVANSLPTKQYVPPAKKLAGGGEKPGARAGSASQDEEDPTA